MNKINSASLSASDQKKYKNLIEGQGLYSRDDDVEILTVDNFKSELYNQKHAWLIEFYNSWCGFCQRFAPSWKALASDLRSWQDLVKIGAIDCTNEDNAPVCRDFEIMTYPTLRYFHENYQDNPKNQGEPIQKGEDMNGHRESLLGHIIQEQQQGRGQIYPNLIPYTGSNLDHLFADVPKGTKYVVLIIERENESTGAEVTMDLHTVANVVVRYSYPNNTALVNKMKISVFPSMLVIDDNKSVKKFADGLKTRESMKMAIKNFLQPKHIEIPEQEAKTEIYTGKWLDAQVPDIDSLFEARQKKLLQDKIKRMTDPVFQMDLETALRWSLKREVAKMKLISGEKLDALLAYLNILVKYFPFGLSGHRFMIQLRDRVANGGGSIEGKEIFEIIKSAEQKDEKLFSSPEQWLACEGSTPEHRGYPCGLWKMFHYLTVSSTERNADNKDANPLEVLRAMEGYIRYFFGCADCAQHFLEMVEKKDMKSVTSLDSSVLWLWMAHNAANKRLAGDQTEDPEFPKIQFPSTNNCPFCKNADNTWNFNEVLKYMKQVYSSINVRYIGSDTRVLHSALEAPIPSKNGGILHSLDTSMCFILYIVSFILMVCLIHMFFKRGYRKKRYVHDLLGKV